MTEQLDLKQAKSYRQGLVLGLTMAEIMILLIFVLLMALAAALQKRDDTISALNDGGAARLIDAIQAAYPEAKNSEDYFKELVRAIDTRKQVEADGKYSSADSSAFAEDARLGRAVRSAAQKAGVDADQFIANASADSARGSKGQWPPFFSLSEAGGYFFDSGKATLRPEFERSLRVEIIPMLIKNVTEYNVDVIEVIGHTDEVPMSGQSNLDSTLILATSGRIPIGDLKSTDNAGLAMARALAVVRILRADKRLSGTSILPMSAAQMIVPVDRMADGSSKGDDQRRRRIEIRLRKSTAQAKTSAVN